MSAHIVAHVGIEDRDAYREYMRHTPRVIERLLQRKARTPLSDRRDPARGIALRRSGLPYSSVIPAIAPFSLRIPGATDAHHAFCPGSSRKSA